MGSVRFEIQFLVLAVLVTAHCHRAPATTGPPTVPPPTDESAFAPDATMARQAVPGQYKWDLSPLFADDGAWQEGLEQAANHRDEVATCLTEAEQGGPLVHCLERYFTARLLTNKLTLYSQMQAAVDQTSASHQAQVERGQAAMEELMALAARLRALVLSRTDEELGLDGNDHPELTPYRPYLRELRRRRAQVLGDEAEAVLSRAGDNLWAEIDLNEIPSDFEKAFAALISQLPLPNLTDEQGNAQPLTLSNFSTLRSSAHRTVRQQAVDGLFGSLRAFDQTFAALLAGQASFSVFLAQSRGYDSAMAAYLHRDNIDPEMYTNLVQAIEDNLEPLHHYVRLRQQLMNLDDLRVADLYPPMVPNVGRRISYEEAQGIIAAALVPLGSDYAAMLGQAMDTDQGWVDLYPHDGKRSGAFAASVYGVHPFIMMNYFGEVRELLTLAHELGHAGHSYLSMANQPYITANYAPLIAETASTFNEVLVLRHLLAQVTAPAERLYLLNQLVETIRTTVYRQALFASFELAVHQAVEQGTPVTAEFLDQTYATLLARYYGEGLTLGPDDGMEWAYVPHFYYKFYVYTYAAGLCAGIALGDGLLAGGDSERTAYLGLLSAGSSKPPLELLRDAGADLSSSAVVEATANLMERSLNEMEAILSSTAAASGK
jgi:oligoendopeptidase F